MGKKTVKYSVVNAFTGTAFKGNPAVVCLLEHEREDEWLQTVAREFNINVTANLIRLTHADDTNSRFLLQWFSTIVEVDLCGHATLAASHYLFTSGLVNSDTIEFSTLSGVLSAKKVDAEITNSLSLDNGGERAQFLIELDFPVVQLKDYNSADIPSVSQALGGPPIIELKYTTKDFLASARGGILNIHLDEKKQRVLIRGIAITVMENSFLV